MLKKQNSLVDDYDNGVEEEFEEKMTSRDYGFILDADGDLKAVVMPYECFELPDKVVALLHSLGVTNPECITGHFIQ